jgi:hemolysin-activating ACP:hemolysin acyltransferase
MYNDTREQIMRFLQIITNSDVKICVENWGVGQQIWLIDLKSSKHEKITHL